MDARTIGACYKFGILIVKASFANYKVVRSGQNDNVWGGGLDYLLPMSPVHTWGESRSCWVSKNVSVPALGNGSGQEWTQQAVAREAGNPVSSNVEAVAQAAMQWLGEPEACRAA